MNIDELFNYLENNSTILTTFKDKAIEYQKEQNEQRLMAQRWSENMLIRAAEKMTKEYVQKVYSVLEQQLVMKDKNTSQDWIVFIQQQNILEQLEESVTEIEFG